MLNEQQLTLLNAVVDTIIPPDEDPGGREAGVVNYLLRQFERDLKPLAPIYAEGLDALEAESLAVNGKSFAILTPDEQASLLTNLENGQVLAKWAIDPTVFINMLADHCAEGFYSDPGNGGNQGEVAWKMIGFEVRG